MADDALGRGTGDALTAPSDSPALDRLGRADNPLVRAVGRAPVTLRTKLLVAFAGIAALLVAVAVLGLGVLGQSNSRVESLGTLQLQASTYQALQTQAQQLRQLLSVRAAADPSQDRYTGGDFATRFTSRDWLLVDKAIEAQLSQLGPALDEAAPPPGDAALLARLRRDYLRFSSALARITANDQANRASDGTTRRLLTETIDVDNDLGAVTDQLATTTRAETDALIAQNRSSYLSSRNLFVAVGAGSVLLAVLLGLVLSWSLVRPIERTEARLAEIAAGDFTRHVEVSNRDELGRLAANLNRMNDELRRVYEELETVSRHKSEFLANMSHELRTPLNAIIGFSELLQQQLYGDLNERQLGYVDDVLDAGRHLLAVINDILDLSKIEAGRMELDLSDVSLRPALESGLTIHAEQAARDGIELALTVDPDDVTIRADERKLRQVVLNLLANAVRFTPAGGRVDVEAKLAGEVVEVAVSDTGPGIDPRNHELIFQEFQQVRQEGKGAHEGTGLGLPLSRRLVELHGGRLWVESAGNGGSTFRFTLPVEGPA